MTISVRAATIAAAPLFDAAHLLLPHLERGQRIDAGVLRAVMDSAFGGSDTEGAWDWKTAYDACEAATVLFLRKFGPVMRSRAGSNAAMAPMLAKIASLLPTHTRRSEESQTLQQFSTPITLGLAASVAAAITPADLVLEPSAGTGLLAIFTELASASCVLNELAESRAGLLQQLFPGVALTKFDAAQIDDHLDAGVAPSVVLMNPPFSALANVDLTIYPGDFISLLGPSGCGKSTLLKIIAGLAAPTTGSIDWPRSTYTADGSPEPALGFVFQEPTLLPWRTAADNLHLPLMLAGVGK